MNNELIKRANDFKDKIGELIDIAEKCNTAIERIDHGNDMAITDNWGNDIKLNDCHLDDGQETLMQQLLIGIFKNRKEEAEAELRQLLPDEPKDINYLELSVRAYNVLKRAGINTIEQLQGTSDEELMGLRNFSQSCLNEVHEKLKEYERR